MLLNLVLPNSTILSFITHVFNPIAKLAISIEMATKEAKAKMGTHPTPEKAKLSKDSV